MKDCNILTMMGEGHTHRTCCTVSVSIGDPRKTKIQQPYCYTITTWEKGVQNRPQVTVTCSISIRELHTSGREQQRALFMLFEVPLLCSVILPQKVSHTCMRALCRQPCTYLYLLQPSLEDSQVSFSLDICTKNHVLTVLCVGTF